MIYCIFPSTLILFGLLCFGTYHFIYHPVINLYDFLHNIRRLDTRHVSNSSIFTLEL